MSDARDRVEHLANAVSMLRPSFAGAHIDAAAMLRAQHEEITRLRAALSAPPPVVPAREVARQVFEVCEDYEATPETPGDSQEVEPFKAGVRFAAKRIRGAIGTWLTDEELSARAAAPQAPTRRDPADNQSQPQR